MIAAAIALVGCVSLTPPPVDEDAWQRLPPPTACAPGEAAHFDGRTFGNLDDALLALAAVTAPTTLTICTGRHIVAANHVWMYLPPVRISGETGVATDVVVQLLPGASWNGFNCQFWWSDLTIDGGLGADGSWLSGRGREATTRYRLSNMTFENFTDGSGISLEGPRIDVRDLLIRNNQIQTRILSVEGSHRPDMGDIHTFRRMRVVNNDSHWSQLIKFGANEGPDRDLLLFQDVEIRDNDGDQVLQFANGSTTSLDWHAYFQRVTIADFAGPQGFYIYTPFGGNMWVYGRDFVYDRAPSFEMFTDRWASGMTHVVLEDSSFTRSGSQGYAAIIISDETWMSFDNVDLGTGMMENVWQDISSCGGSLGVVSGIVDAAVQDGCP